MSQKKQPRKLRQQARWYFKKDPLYNSYWMEKFINKFMKAGQKQIVEKQVLHAFKKIKQKTGCSTFSLFLRILVKFRPLFGFISKRVGKQFKKVPVPLRPRRQTIISLKWFTTSMLLDHLHSFEWRLIHEFLALNARKKNALWKRYTEYLSELQANRLNGRFRWK